MPTVDRSESPRREVSNAVTAVVLRYARLVGGDEGVARVLALAGETRSVEELENSSEWSSAEHATALFVALADVTSDPDVGYRVGEELLKQHRGTEVAAALRSLGSPSEVLRNIASTSSKYSTVTRSTALKIGPSEGLVEHRPVAGFARERHLCDYTKGALTQVSPLFGLPPATVVELECAVEGAERCLYQVSWESAPTAAEELRQRAEFLESELAAMSSRFEQLQNTATELVSAGNVEEALRAITQRAGLAVRAPQFLLAVRLTPLEPVRVHSIGFSNVEADSFAVALLDGEVGGTDDSTLVVEIRAGARYYGRLAAVLPTGARFFAHEEQVLEAYAAFAAAALDTAAALELSRQRDRTARALLDLAKSLTRARTEGEACARAAAAVIAVTGCDRSRVWLREGDSIRLAAIEGEGAPTALESMAERTTWVADGQRSVTIPLADSPFSAGMIRDQRPVFVVRESAAPDMKELLEVTGEVATAVAPIAGQDGFIGMIAAAVLSDADRLREDDDLIERLTGIGDQAAIAITNARLVDQIRHQAFHDALTGLPNIRLLEDRVEQALRAAGRDGTRGALLFVDLDRFKAVNDSFGHQQGDELLVQVATRLKSTLRAGDTVARVGGDEFCILLPEVNDHDAAVLVGQKVVDRLREPFDLDHQEAKVGASVGVAMFPDEGRTFAALLKASDSAMYRAKTGGRGLVR